MSMLLVLGVSQVERTAKLVTDKLTESFDFSNGHSLSYQVRAREEAAGP